MYEWNDEWAMVRRDMMQNANNSDKWPSTEWTEREWNIYCWRPRQTWIIAFSRFYDNRSVFHSSFFIFRIECSNARILESYDWHGIHWAGRWSTPTNLRRTTRLANCIRALRTVRADTSDGCPSAFITHVPACRFVRCTLHSAADTNECVETWNIGLRQSANLWRIKTVIRQNVAIN